MKRIYNIAVLLLTVMTATIACKDNVEFPDPGFDLLTDRDITVWLDTTDRAYLQLNIIAPGGVDFIELLDGRTYETIEKFTEYHGKKNFTFAHSIDIGHLDRTRDTTLMYNVRVFTLDHRGYNTGFRLHVQKLSVPEITVPTKVIGVSGNIVGIRGLVKTGYYNIKSIKVFIDGKEEYAVPDEELDGVREYNLSVNLTYNIVRYQDYDMRIEIIDERNEILNEYLTIKGIVPRKVTAIDFNSENGYEGLIHVRYNEDDRITEIEYIHPEEKHKDRNWIVILSYNSDGLVDEISYYHTDDLKYKPDRYKVFFTYSGGLLTLVEHKRYSDKWEFYNNHETIRNIQYRADGTYESFDANLTSIEDIQYADGFTPGERLFAERWRRNISSSYIDKRGMKTDFVPIDNPVYIHGMPPLWYPYYSEINSRLLDLFFYRYLYLDEIPIPLNPSEIDVWSMYEYEVDDVGLLTKFIEDEYAKWFPGWYNIFEYIYEELDL